MSGNILPAAASGAKSETASQSGPLGILHRTVLLVSLPLGILNFVLPIYGHEIGASAVEIGLLFSAFSLMTVALRPLVGVGLDRLGRRGFFIAGLALYGLTMLGFAFASEVWGLLAARLLQGAASALLWLAINAIVADLSTEDERARNFGGVIQASNRGAVAGTFIGFTALISMGFAAGWPALFAGYALIGLASALIALRAMPETRPIGLRAGEGGAAAGLRAILHSRSLTVLLGISVITGASSAMLAPILMIFLQERFQAEVSTLAWAFFPAGMAWTVLPARMGKLSDRFGRGPLIALSLGAAAVVSLLIPQIHSLPALAALWVLEAVCFTASDPAGQALISDRSAEEVRGRVYGVFALAGGLGAIAGPLVGGWMYDSMGQATPFAANAAALAACALIAAAFMRER